jgi:hypothetical protein
MLKWGFPQISPITKITVKSPNKVYPNSVYTRIFVFEGASRSRSSMEKTESEKEIVRKFYMVLRTCFGFENGVGEFLCWSPSRDDDAMGIRRIQLGFFRFVRGKDSH